MRLFRPETDVVEKMFPIRAGQRLRFVKVSGPSSSEAAVDSGSLSETRACPERDQDPGRPVLRVDVAAAGITIQDWGRAGWRRFGVPASGAMDDHAAQWSNRLLQNPGHLPVLEMAGAGQRLGVLESGWLSVSGAGQVRTRDGKVHAWQAFRVQAGDRLEVVPGSGGVWTYLAVPHGFHNRSVLGSFSSFIRAGVGEVISSGTILRHSNAATFDWPESVAARRVAWTEQLTYEDAPVIRVWSAPQTSQFTDRTLELWTNTTWIVSQQMDRVGYRLEGPTLDPLEEAMISEPMLPGTIQVPSGGQPLITLADGPTLGGYPKLGVVDPYDLRRFAQVRPGQGVRFVWAKR
jgi:biotin-dependent carboxylase-like uncharacterized protein